MSLPFAATFQSYRAPPRRQREMPARARSNQAALEAQPQILNKSEDEVDSLDGQAGKSSTEEEYMLSDDSDADDANLGPARKLKGHAGPLLEDVTNSTGYRRTRSGPGVQKTIQKNDEDSIAEIAAKRPIGTDESKTSQANHATSINEVEALTMECADLKRDSRRLRKKLSKTKAACNEEIADLNEQLQKMQVEIDGQNRLIKKAQEHAFQTGDQGGWATDEDSTINSGLGLLERLMKDFGKHFAPKSMSGPKLLHTLRAHPSKRFVSTKGYEHIQAMATAKVPAHLALSACVASWVSANILGNHLFFLDDMERALDEDSQIAEAFTKLMGMITFCKFITFARCGT